MKRQGSTRIKRTGFVSPIPPSTRLSDIAAAQRRTNRRIDLGCDIAFNNFDGTKKLDKRGRQVGSVHRGDRVFWNSKAWGTYRKGMKRPAA